MDANPGKARLAGWNESVLERVTPLLIPPINSTLPSASKVAVWPARPVDRAWLEVKVNADGSKISVVLSEMHAVVHESYPPTRRICPVVRSVAVSLERGTVMFPVG